ncbi:MAG: ATP-binding cassette domain-containing protein, partial [Planctomycetota bacterium]
MSSYLLEDVSVLFREEAAVSGVDLRVEPGERVGIVGPSGAGKTTLLRLLIGALRPSTGTVSVDGRDLSTLNPRELRALRARTGFVHQDHRLVPNQRVVSNVRAGRLGRWAIQRSLRGGYRPRRP